MRSRDNRSRSPLKPEERKARQPAYVPEHLNQQDNTIYALSNEADDLRRRIAEAERKDAEDHKTQYYRQHDKLDHQLLTLENDKLALMKRLNMVLVELDRGT